jgi:hypothetical protein
MKYKCRKCGNVVEEEDLPTNSYYDDRGEFWGTSCGEELKEIDYSCQHCYRGEYEEAEECICCGEGFFYEELYEGYCKDCLEEQMTDDNIEDFFKYEESYEAYLELKERKYSNQAMVEELSNYDSFAWWLVSIKNE